MPTLLFLISLIGQPVRLPSDLGSCRGTVVGIGVATLEGTCSLNSGADLIVGDGWATVRSFRTLPSGRVLVRFGGAL